MKINTSDLQTQLSVYRTTQVQGNSKDTAAAGKREDISPQQDRVALSAKGRMIADAQRVVAQLPDVRESLVAGIQSEVENGSYVVDSQKAAEGLLRESFVNQAALAA